MVGETGSSCYNFHVFKHIMQTKRATLIIFSTRCIPLLIKISESFEIQVNILKILRNKQSTKIATTYPKVGVSCYTLYDSTLSTVWPSQTWYKVHMCLWGYVHVGVYMCHCVCLFVCLFVYCFFVCPHVKCRWKLCTLISTAVMKETIWTYLLKCIDMVYFWAQLDEKSDSIAFKPTLYHIIPHVLQLQCNNLPHEYCNNLPQGGIFY